MISKDLRGIGISDHSLSSMCQKLCMRLYCYCFSTEVIWHTWSVHQCKQNILISLHQVMKWLYAATRLPEWDGALDAIAATHKPAISCHFAYPASMCSAVFRINAAVIIWLHLKLLESAKYRLELYYPQILIKMVAFCWISVTKIYMHLCFSRHILCPL